MASEIPAEEIRGQLARILASDGFRDAGRLGGFLKFIVEAALNGQPVKESVLGTEVFERAADYDPKTDPIVRVEAPRLRSRLEDFYQKNIEEPVRIDLPKGGYVPAFARTSAGAPEAARVTLQPLAGRVIVIGILVMVVGAISWMLWERNRAMNSPTPAVAVLPFRNLSTDSDNEYFSDGLTVELIDALTKVQNLRVVSWNSASRYRGKAGSLQELRDQLQAGSVVDGTVRKQGDRLRITAQLVDTNSSETIWSGTYERKASDIFQIQEEIAKSIVYSLKVQLRVDPQRILVPPRTESADAYNDYLRGRYYRNQFSREGFAKSNEYCEKAIGEDPKYAPPYALLATNYTLLGFYNVMPLGEASEKAKAAAQKAIELAPSSGEAHAALGTALSMGDWNWKAARVELDRAVQWSPGSADAHSSFAIAYLAPMGQFEAAEYEAAKAIQLDPLSFLANYVAGTISLAQGKNQEAIDHFRTALAIYQDFGDVHWDYGMALAAAGRKEEARKEFIKTCELQHIKNCDEGPVGHAILGDKEKSRAELAEQKPRPIEAARVWALLGEPDQAFAALDQAIAQRDPQVMYLRTDTRFASVRNDPRYGAALQRLKLTE